MTCPRCAVVALVLFALAGCDSNNPGRDLALIQGVYAIEALSFDPVTGGLPTADVIDRLDAAGTRLEIFGEDEESLLIVRYNDATGSRRVNLRTTASRGRATFEAIDADDEADLAALFLPPSFVLTYEGESPRVLTGSLDRTGVNLEAFDRSVYQDQRANRGTLVIRFRRP